MSDAVRGETHAPATYTVCRYVPHRLADAYREQGWDVRLMPMNHGEYSHLVSMEFAGE